MSNINNANEYIYITIPKDYICIYHKILYLFADYGIDMLKDCSASCNGRNKKIIDCFNMFNAAIAANKIGKDKLAETLIKYIENQLKLIYSDEIEQSIVYPVNDEGHIVAVVTCGDNPTFCIDPTTGKLYEYRTENTLDKYMLDEKDFSTN